MTEQTQLEELKSNLPNHPIWDVLSERARQMREKGWTPEHDDEHQDGSLAKAGACYALCTVNDIDAVHRAVELFPWGAKGPSTNGGSRTMLVKAAALIIAEIERLDRAEAK